MGSGDLRGAEHLGALLRSQSGLAVKVQLLSAEGRPAWPLENRRLEQRFEDALGAALTVSTRPAFVAGETATWCDRRASRDLWDLWALSRIGAFEPDVVDLYRRFGPTNKLPRELTSHERTLFIHQGVRHAEKTTPATGAQREQIIARMPERRPNHLLAADPRRADRRRHHHRLRTRRLMSSG
ncbi:MAG: nucleotidyl transferase AbiEii/AbiGii toxin family protein [Rhodococcus sp. (in: high G+C Gram-positive bacteria)]